MGSLDAIVFEPTPAGQRALSPWRVSRTVRALTRLGTRAVVITRASALAEALRMAPGPRWLVRAGAVPIATPRLPAPSATGRALLGFGAIERDDAWTSLLGATGGELSDVAQLPAVCSVFVDQPAELAKAAIEVLPKLARSPGADTLAQICLAAPKGTRRVRLPAFDVAFTEGVHVVQLVTTLHRGGAERIVLDLSRELTALGVDVTLAVLDRASRTTFDGPRDAVFLDTLAHGSRRSRMDLLADVARARGADLIHAHLVNGGDLHELARSGVPVVTTIHNSEPGWPVKLDALACADLALTIACSRDVERQLEEARFPSVVRTVWNGITHRRPKNAENMHANRATIRLLTVANHRPQKRLERLPAVVAELRRRGHDARILIVGEPVKNDPEMSAIEGRIRSEAAALGVAEHVELVGSRSDVASLYASHDAVVSASAFEGLSLVHLECLAAGLPLVTTAVAGTDELTRKHAHAHVVPLDASASLFADALLRVLASRSAPGPSAPLEREAAPASLAADFTATKMAERHADLFARVLTTSRRSPASSPRLGIHHPPHLPTRDGLVLIANNFSTGGAQSSARRLLVALAAAGVRVRAIVLQEQTAFPTPGRSALASAGIDVLVAPRAGDVDPLVTARAIARSIDEHGDDAVLFWNVISQHKVLIADLLFDTPIWDVSPGEMYFASFTRYLEKPRVGSPYLTMRDYGRRLSGVIVKYEAERSRAEEALGVSVDVVPNGVVVPPVRPDRPHSEASSARGDRIVIGALARLGADKKLEQLVDAVAHAAGRGLLAHCEVRIAGGIETGDDAYVASLRERSRGLPITWVGEQDSATFLSGLDLFAMVSEPSGCPNASLEAMAAGLAVVATDVGGAREQIVHGETGLLVPRGDAEALGEAIAALAMDPARRDAMGRAGHVRARTHFDVRRMACDYARICLGTAVSLFG